MSIHTAHLSICMDASALYKRFVPNSLSKIGEGTERTKGKVDEKSVNQQQQQREPAHLRSSLLHTENGNF